jgi:hypothetical protein
MSELEKKKAQLEALKRKKALEKDKQEFANKLKENNLLYADLDPIKQKEQEELLFQQQQTEKYSQNPAKPKESKILIQNYVGV